MYVVFSDSVYVPYAYTLFRKGTYGRNLPQVAGILSYPVYYY